MLGQLLTKGLNDEARVETEIGRLPRSWKVMRLEELVKGIDYGTSVKCGYPRIGVPVLRIPNVIRGSISLSDLKYGQPKPRELSALALTEGDLLFVRTNGAQENAGRCAMFRGELEECYFASYLIRVRTDSDLLLPGFLNEYARSVRGKSFLSGRAIRTADGKFNINTGTLKNVLIPLPDTREQERIVSAIEILDRKVSLHQNKVATFTALLHALLHKFMTAQLRIGDLEVPVAGEAATVATMRS